MEEVLVEVEAEAEAVVAWVEDQDMGVDLVPAAA